MTIARSARGKAAYSVSDSSSDTESDVEYEPIVINDQDGNQITLAENSEPNPLAPIASVGGAASSSALSITPSFASFVPKKKKKGKVFASKDVMLAMIESVNVVQDVKVKEKLDRNFGYLQRQNQIEKSMKDRKSKKGERLDKIKDNLRKGGVRLKGENKQKVREIRAKKDEDGKRQKKTNTREFNANHKKPKKQVKFADDI